VSAQVAAIDDTTKEALRSYLAGVSDVVRLREQEARKALSLSGSTTAAREAIDQAKSASPYTADVYISSARHALSDMNNAEQERADAEKQRRGHVKALRAALVKLRPALSGYSLVSDAELAKLDPPEKPAPKAS
jgi:hypothetical protein